MVHLCIAVQDIHLHRDRSRISGQCRSSLWWRTSGSRRCGPLRCSCCTPSPKTWRGRHICRRRRFLQMCTALSGWEEGRMNQNRQVVGVPLCVTTFDLQIPTPLQCDWKAYIHLGRSRISCLGRSWLWWRTTAGCLCGLRWCTLCRICPRKWRGSGKELPPRSRRASSQLWSQGKSAFGAMQKNKHKGETATRISASSGFYLGLFPKSRTRHRQSGRLPAHPDQEGKREPKVRPCRRKGKGPRDLNRKRHRDQTFWLCQDWVRLDRHTSAQVDLPALPKEIMMSAVPS